MPPRKRRVAKPNREDDDQDGDGDVKGSTTVHAQAFDETPIKDKPKPAVKNSKKKLEKSPAKTPSSATHEDSQLSSTRQDGINWLPLLCALLAGALLTMYAFSHTNIDVVQSLTHYKNTWFGGLHESSKPGEARGFFPQGCKWRDVIPNREVEKWALRQYEYWDEATERWTPNQPPACLLHTQTFPHGYPRDEGRTYQQCGATHCVYHNLWYNDGNWYRVADVKDKQTWKQIARDVQLQELRVLKPGEFIANSQARFVPGDTLVLDFVYFLHPTAIGHWLEHLTPLFSVLEAALAPRPERVLLLHLKRAHVFEWVRSVLAVALGVRNSNDSLPPIYFQEEVPSIWAQIGTPLEGVSPSEWICFERALLMKDTFHDGNRTALSPQLARMFRSRAYHLHNLPSPEEVQLHGEPVLPPPPQVITFQRKTSNRRVINEVELIELLSQFGEVRIVEFDATTPFTEQLVTVSTTGVFLSVHTSNLANAFFLPPGRAVVELIQRNWVWPSLDTSFREQTRSLGDVHHFAWRSHTLEPGIYINPRDEVRFGGSEWAGTKCDTEECVEAHTNVDVVVNIAELRKLLASRLPLVYEGRPVEEIRLPWPIKDP